MRLAADILAPEDLPALTSTLTDAQDVVVRFEGDTFRMRLGENTIDFISTAGTRCISLEIDPSYIYLSNYYFYEDLAKCPKVAHNVFFKFLKKLSSVYNLPVELSDASSKKFAHTDCSISAVVFSLAGEPTFYERFGFRNPAYTSEIRALQSKTLRQVLMDKALTDRIKRTRKNIRKDDSLHTIEAMLRKEGMDWSTPLQTLAVYLVRACKRAHKHNREFARRGNDSDTRVMVRTRKYKTSVDTYQWGRLLAWLQNSVLYPLGIPGTFVLPIPSEK
jgi:hypothetical protein